MYISNRRSTYPRLRSTPLARPAQLTASIVIAVVLLLLVPSTATPPRSAPHPSIPIQFHLDRPSLVTLVVEDDSGQRVRNLVSETHFPAGDNVAWWDGLDDLGRDPNSAAHSVYNVPGKLVSPGTYTVRGLIHQKIDLKYEFSVYNPGQPPWMTSDTSSEWLTNHTPADTVCFIPAGNVPAHGRLDVDSPPQVLIGSYVAEGGSGLAWVGLDGRKLHGQMWVGGVWTGAQEIARDEGDHPIPNVYAYVASTWGSELRLHKLVNEKHLSGGNRDTRFGTGEDPPVLSSTWKFSKESVAGIGGLAAYNGTLIVSLSKIDELLFIDVAHSRAIGTLPVSHPGGLYADSKGNLFIISHNTVLKAKLPDAQTATGPPILGTPQILIANGLQNPQQLTMDSANNLYVSDWGTSNQVKVFSPTGKPIHAIGTAGVPVSGPYDPKLMHHPKGVAIDSRNQLWVAEEDFQPKRVSVWNLNGSLVHAFYGPPPYGGGGNLDPRDKTLFYMDGMTFRLNWTSGESRLTAIHYRPKENEPLIVPEAAGWPQTASWQEPGGHYKRYGASQSPDLPIYAGTHKYFTNAYNIDPTSGSPVVGLWIDNDGIALPVAAFGRVDWWPLLATEPFHSRLVQAAGRFGAPNKPANLSDFTFIWSDRNDNHIVDPDEVTIGPGFVHTATLSDGLEFVTDAAASYKPVSFTSGGAPLYDLSRHDVLLAGTQKPASSGGGQVLPTRGHWTVLTTGPKPFAPESLAGAENGVSRWEYPSLWPGLHASHNAPSPDHPGELIGTTRLLGPSFQLKNAKDIELWAVNGNKGTIYLFTSDGLFVTTLFQDTRLPSASWSKHSQAVRGMSVSDVTAGEENFWPSITQTSDGQVYVVTNFPGIVRVDGLDTLQRLPSQTIHLTDQVLEQARSYTGSAEFARQPVAGQTAVLTVPVSTSPGRLNEDLSNWDPKQFVVIDKSASQVDDPRHSDQQATAAMRIAGDRLYVAFRTGNPHALENSGASWTNLFKTGAALDLMLSTNPNSDPQRKSPVAGDIRLLVSLVKGKPTAVLYRPVATGGARNAVLFESPLRSLRFDDVEDVSSSVELAIGRKANVGTGDFEFSIPLSVLGLSPTPGEILRGDLGLLRGDGLRTTQRVYWSNKATGLVSDIPSEASLTPQLWGTLRLVRESERSQKSRSAK